MRTSEAGGRAATETALDDSEAPRAWLTVAAAFGSMFTVFGVAYSFGAFFDPMAQEFHAGSAAESAVYGVTAFLYFGLGVVSGPATDRFGPRRVLAAGAVGIGVGLILTAQVHQLWQGYITYGLGVGIGVGCGYVPMVTAVSVSFQRRRTTAVGIAVSGIGLGTLTVVPLAAALIAGFGWRTAYVVLGILAAVVLGGCAVIAGTPPRRLEGSGTERPRIRSREFALLYVSATLISFALSVALVHLAPSARRLGVASVPAAALLGVVGAASIVGRLGLGPIADRIGSVRAYKGSLLIMAASYALWLLATGYAWLLLFALLMGVGYGGFIAINPAVMADLFGVERLGTFIGLLYTAAGVGSLAGPVLAGLLVDATAGYRAPVATAWILGLGGWAILLPLADRRSATPRDLEG